MVRTGRSACSRGINDRGLGSKCLQEKKMSRERRNHMMVFPRQLNSKFATTGSLMLAYDSIESSRRD